MEFATKTIHAGQPSEPETGSLIAPIFQTSTYEQDEPGVNRGFDYSRTNNPTRARLEAVLAELEGVQVLRHVRVGTRRGERGAPGLPEAGRRDRHPARRLRRHLPDPEQGVPADRLRDQADRPGAATGALEAALSPKTKLVWIESPTNPRLLVYDIAAIAAATHAAGALLVVDNTFASPLFQQPFQLGADLVVHSVTKYLAGHSDVIQGAVLAKEASVFEPVKFLQNATGAVPAPFDCWLTLRGLKTLELRMQRHADNAEAIAKALERTSAREASSTSRACRDHPGHEIAKRQMTGFGGMVSFELNGTVEEVVSFVSSRRFFALGESLGGVKALVCHPARMTHASIPAEERAKLGLSDTLVRLSTGCEHQRDLVADLLEGLAAIEQARALAVINRQSL